MIFLISLLHANVPTAETVSLSSFISAATPKSASLQTPSFVIKILAALISLCNILFK